VAFTAMNIQVEVFWVVTPCDGIPPFRRTLLPPLHPVDGGSEVLRNGVIVPQHYTATQPTRSRLDNVLVTLPERAVW